MKISKNFKEKFGVQKLNKYIEEGKNKKENG